MTRTRSLVFAFVVLVGIATLGVTIGGFLMGPGAMGPGMMGGYYGATPGGFGGWGLAMGIGMIAMFAFWAAVVVGIMLLVRASIGTSSARSPSSESEEPLAILRRRYAAGEIDDAAYGHMKKQLVA